MIFENTKALHGYFLKGIEEKLNSTIKNVTLKKKTEAMLFFLV